MFTCLLTSSLSVDVKQHVYLLTYQLASVDVKQHVYLLTYQLASVDVKQHVYLLTYRLASVDVKQHVYLLTYPARFCGRKKPMFTCFSIICMIDGGPNCLSPISVAKLILRGDSLYWMGTRGFFFSIFSRCGFVFKCLLTSRLDLVPWSQARIVSKYFWSSR